jgi:pimeloyl-ACP methyl ester carboxylesterase
MPGTRAESFYHLPNADPQVIATDERTKQTATVLEARDVFEQELPGVLGGPRTGWYGVTPAITVPVLDVVGQYDSLLCGRTQPNSCADPAMVQANESAYYSETARFAFVQVPAAGHDLNLHRNAQAWFGLANRWAAGLRQAYC